MELWRAGQSAFWALCVLSGLILQTTSRGVHYVKFQPVEVSKENKLISKASVSLDAMEKAVLHITCLLQFLLTHLNWCEHRGPGASSLTTVLIAGILPHRPVPHLSVIHGLKDEYCILESLYSLNLDIFFFFLLCV